jgi:hypothetical protein
LATIFCLSTATWSMRRSVRWWRITELAAMPTSISSLSQLSISSGGSSPMR